MRRLAVAIALAFAAAPLAAQAPPDWTRGATCYEVFVRSFQDSNGDGIGDLKGLISRLDYINDGSASSQSDLGARCIWLMPIDESPSYHGYDVTDYYAVEKDYGTRDDFRQLMEQAHRRGIKVLVDLVLNHASNEHPYFKEALRDTTSQYRRWFRFSATKPNEKGPWGQDPWHKSPVRDEWYYGVFWAGMPDLNYETPAVREEANRVARFWIDSMGVDGFRLDAIPFLIEEGGRTAGTAGTHAVLRDWSTALRAMKPDVYTVGEVWDSTGAMLPYYPDQLTSHFAFEIADGIVKAVRSGSARNLLAPVLRLQRDVPAQRWSPFLRNHDQARTRTELGGDLRKARLASAILLTMPGLPFVYYGEEIGMSGAKPDERLRTPMQWTRSTTAGQHGGFTTGTPWEALQPDSQAVTVEAQSGDPRSILTLHRRLIHLRASNAALAAGELVPLTTSSDKVSAFVRRDGERAVLVVANLGDAPARGVTIGSSERVLAAGRYAARDIVDASEAPTLVMDTAGRLVRWAPMRVLAPLELYLFELTSVPTRTGAATRPR